MDTVVLERTYIKGIFSREGGQGSGVWTLDSIDDENGNAIVYSDSSVCFTGRDCLEGAVLNLLLQADSNQLFVGSLNVGGMSHILNNATAAHYITADIFPAELYDCHLLFLQELDSDAANTLAAHFQMQVLRHEVDSAVLSRLDTWQTGHVPSGLRDAIATVATSIGTLHLHSVHVERRIVQMQAFLNRMRTFELSIAAGDFNTRQDTVLHYLPLTAHNDPNVNTTTNQRRHGAIDHVLSQPFFSTVGDRTVLPLVVAPLAPLLPPARIPNHHFVMVELCLNDNAHPLFNIDVEFGDEEGYSLGEGEFAEDDFGFQDDEPEDDYHDDYYDHHNDHYGSLPDLVDNEDVEGNISDPDSSRGAPSDWLNETSVPPDAPPPQSIPTKQKVPRAPFYPLPQGQLPQAASPRHTPPAAVPTSQSHHEASVAFGAPTETPMPYDQGRF